MIEHIGPQGSALRAVALGYHWRAPLGRKPQLEVRPDHPRVSRGTMTTWHARAWRLERGTPCRQTAGAPQDKGATVKHSLAVFGLLDRPCSANPLASPALPAYTGRRASAQDRWKEGLKPWRIHHSL